MNNRERLVQQEFINSGYEVLSKGYPDFLAWNEDKKEAVFIEVKRKQKRPSIKMGLSKHQRRMMWVLRDLGLRVEIRYVD